MFPEDKREPDCRFATAFKLFSNHLIFMIVYSDIIWEPTETAEGKVNILKY